MSGEPTVQERLRRLYRGLELSAGIMRDPERTGRWSGARRTADAFARHAAEAKALWFEISTEWSPTATPAPSSEPQVAKPAEGGEVLAVAREMLFGGLQDLIWNQPSVATMNDARRIASAVRAYLQDAALTQPPTRPVEGAWRPISDEAKEGDLILIWRETRWSDDTYTIVRWEDDWWQVHDGKTDHPLRGPDPQWWQPCPPAPADTREER